MPASTQACITPTAREEIPKRVYSMHVNAVFIPPPTGPRILEFGIRQSLKNSCPVSEERHPNFDPILCRVYPGVSFSTINVVIPLVPLLLSVCVSTTAKSDTVALVIQVLFPFRTHPSPFGTAVVSTAVASLPVLG